MLKVYIEVKDIISQTIVPFHVVRSIPVDFIGQISIKNRMLIGKKNNLNFSLLLLEKYDRDNWYNFIRVNIKIITNPIKP